jgi:hypothetical protein
VTVRDSPEGGKDSTFTDWNLEKQRFSIDPSGTRNFVPRKRIRSEEYPEGFGEGYLSIYLTMR